MRLALVHSPSRGDRKLFGSIVFQQNGETVVSEGIGDVLDNLIEKCFEVENGRDLLRYTLKQIELFDSQNVIEIVESLCSVERG